MRLARGQVVETQTLEVVLGLLRAADAEVLPRLSAAVASTVPHSCAAALVAGQIRTAYSDDGGAQPTIAELAVLAERTAPGLPWYGRARVVGATRPALALVATEPRAAGNVLVLADVPDTAQQHDAVQLLWEIAAIRLSRAGQPHLHTAAERFAAGEHAKQLLAGRDAHAATLTAILGALRSRRLDDGIAREVATAVASTALTSLRAVPSAGEHAAGQAFASLTGQLRPLVRHLDVALELAPPERSDSLLPPQVSEAATAVAQGCVLVMLEHTAPRRIRVGWEVRDGQLTVSVRDDGDGALFPQALAEYRLRERLAALGGDFAVDAVPGWGTAVTAAFPLSLPPGADMEVIGTLSPRELEVLAELARGLGNRQIAERLHVTEHTVKFHVGHILSKLGVDSRGEAAAMGRAARF